MRRIRRGLVLLIVFAQPLLAVAAEPRVVENSAHGLWDDKPRKTFGLLEDLYVAGDDEENGLIFGRISDIAVDSRNRMLILDGGFSCVKVYDPDSMVVHTIGRQGEGPGEFNQPTAIAVDAEGRIYVASQGGRIGIFAPNGEWIEEFRHQFPAGFVIDMEAVSTAFYVACYDYVDKKVVHRYDATHRYVSSFSDSWSVVKPTPPGELWGQGGFIDVDSNGYVYYTQFTPYEIRKFSPEGELLVTIHRENDYMKPPRIERNGDAATFYGYSASICILALSNGMILNVVSYVPSDTDIVNVKTVFDLFDADGRLLKSIMKEGRIVVRCRDAQGRVYASRESDVPEVVRYRLAFQ
jgi:hypothetical protein